MGKGLSQIKVPKRTPRVGRAQQAMTDTKYLGKEPTFTGPLTSMDYISALNWYNYMETNSEAKKYIAEYLKNLGRLAESKLIRAMSDNQIPTTVGWTCRLWSRGFVIPEDSKEYVETRLAETIIRATESYVSEDEAPKRAIQERMADKQSEILGEVEGFIDDYMAGEEVNLFTWMKGKNIAPRYAPAIVDRIAPYLGEALEALDTTDPQLKEGYRNYSKPKLKQLIAFFNSLIEDAEKYSESEKKVRKVRTKKAPSIEKVLENFKYLKENSELKIASVDPTKVLGSQEVWCYNTKYKILSVLRSLDRGGLSIKGTTFVNVDETTSKSYRTGRKGAELAHKVINLGKVGLRKVTEGLSEAGLALRTNENTLLLRVV